MSRSGFYRAQRPSNMSSRGPESPSGTNPTVAVSSRLLKPLLLLKRSPIEDSSSLFFPLCTREKGVKIHPGAPRALHSLLAGTAAVVWEVGFPGGMAQVAVMSPRRGASRAICPSFCPHFYLRCGAPCKHHAPSNPLINYHVLTLV